MEKLKLALNSGGCGDGDLQSRLQTLAQKILTAKGEPAGDGQGGKTKGSVEPKKLSELTPGMGSYLAQRIVQKQELATTQTAAKKEEGAPVKKDSLLEEMNKSMASVSVDSEILAD